MKKKFLLGFLVVLILVVSVGLAQPARAAEIDEDGEVAKGEIIADDLLLSGEAVVMNGTIEGNLLAAGNSVTIGGVVEGDVLVGANLVELLPGSVVKGNMFIGASSVVLNGTVEGSVFSGSAYFTAGKNALIEGNLYSGSYALELTSGSLIGVDVFSGSAQARLAGEIGRDATLGSAAVSVEGSIGRNAKIDIGDAAESGTDLDPSLYMPDVPRQYIPEKINIGLRVDEDARIGGELNYTSSVELSNNILSQPAGGVVFSTPVPNEDGQTWMERSGNTGFATKAVIDWIWHNAQLFLVTLLGGLAAVGLWHNCLKDTATVAKEKIWTNLGIGLIAIPSVYLASVMVFGMLIVIALLLWVITLGGLGWNVFSMFSLALMLFMSVFGLYIKFGTAILGAWVIGEFLRDRLFPNSGKYVAILVGAVAFGILAGIPVLGWLFRAFVALVGVGALWTAIFKKRFIKTDTDGYVSIGA